MMKLKGMRQTYCVNYQARAGQHGLLVVYDRSGPAIWFVFLRFSGADSCIQTRYSVPRFMINFPQRFRITDLLPGFSNYANILNSFPVDNDN